jgi:large subunit ribosomal protein L3
MPRTRNPRKGSLQFWPRKRARNISARIRNWSSQKEAKPLAFAGYKTGMTHVTILDQKPTSITKGEEIVVPATIVECPPITVVGIAVYVKNGTAFQRATTIMADKLPPSLSRVLPLPKKQKQKNIEAYDAIRLLVMTNPEKTGIGKKKPELFEINIGGSPKDAFTYATNNLGKEITINDVFAPGAIVDIHAVTKGKGYQGPVKRFGVAIRHHKSEKTKRGPGSLGPWHGPRLWRVSHAGQMGFHTRTEYNKQIIKIDQPKTINPTGAFLRYGNVKNTYVLFSGSIPGPTKRLIKFTAPTRLPIKSNTQAPTITQISTISRQ